MFSLALAACGGGGGDDGGAVVPPVIAADAASASIGAAGGTVTTAGGAQVVIPAGALGATTTIAIERSDAGAPALPVGATPAGVMYAFTPHGTSFSAPVSVSVPVDLSTFPAGLTPIFYKTNAAGAWERIAGATLSGTILTATVTGFSNVIAMVPPQITQQPRDVTVNAGSVATFSVTALGSPPFSYQWQKSTDAGVTWNDILLAIARTYTTPAAVDADNGSRYRVVVSSPDGPATSQSATLMVTVPVIAPAITTQPAAASIGVGASATFTVGATGTAPIYRWEISRNAGVSFSDAGNATPSLTHANAPLADNGVVYRVVVSNSAGSVTSANAVLTVTAAPPPPPPPAATAQRIAAGTEFSLAVNAAGVPYSWGSDQTAALGNGNASNVNLSTATPLGTITGIRSVSAGNAGVVVKTDGTVWAFGYNGYINCGAGNIAEAPQQIAGAANIVAASAGNTHTLLLRGDGKVLSFGCNDQGQLGRPIGSVPFGSPATEVPGLPTIVAVAAGGAFSLAVDSSGFVWAWGAAGARGDGRNIFGPPRATPEQALGVSGVIAIAAGTDHAVALRSNGFVATWGLNNEGQLGTGTTAEHWLPTSSLLTSRIVAISVGNDSSLALRDDGVVLSWGQNNYDQLGTGAGYSMPRATPEPVLGLTNAVAVAMGKGTAHALALRSDGTVWSWGNNRVGQLGIGTITPRLAPGPVSGLNLN